MGKTKETKPTARTEVPRWLRVKVTRDDIGHAIMAKSTGCAISDAIARTYPDIERPVTDIRSARVTFPDLAERAEYKMSLAGALFIVRFDRGDRDLDGFELRLPLAAHTPVKAATKGARDRSAAKRATRVAKKAAGVPLTPDERSAETRDKGDRPYSRPPRTFETGPDGALQVGGKLTPIAPGASGPSVSANDWGESGASTSRGRRPRHYRGFGVHALGQHDPAVMATAGEVYDPDPDT